MKRCNKDFKILYKEDDKDVRHFTFIIISYVFDDDKQNIIDYPTIKKINIDF